MGYEMFILGYIDNENLGGIVKYNDTIISVDTAAMDHLD